MKSKFVLGVSLILSTLLMVSPLQTTSAAEKTKVMPGVVSSDKNTGVTIYRDAAGGLVFSGLPVPSTATEEEQRDQKVQIAKDESNLENPNKSNDVKATSNYVDYEYHPIYIGTWNNHPSYARHTLGSYNSSTKYLTSYGYTSWYNTSGLNALPYRNGATNDGANQGVVDVAKGSSFAVRDLGKNVATTLKITDWGPSQDSFPNRISDLDRNVFSSLHGNYGDGYFYSRTYVPVVHYYP